MNASHRLFFPAVSAVFVSVLALVTGVSCNRKPEGGETTKAPSVVDALMAEGKTAREKGDYAKALAAFQKALALTDKEKDPKSWTVTATKVALLHKKLAAWKEAEALFTEILLIREKHYGPAATETAEALSNLAQVLQDTNRLLAAEPLLKRAISIFEISCGKSHPNVATAINNLAQLFQATDRMKEAEPLMRRALAIDEATYGKDHPAVASDLNNLAMLLQEKNWLAEAEPLMRRALAIDEAFYGKSHSQVATALNNLAQLLKRYNRLEEAEPLMRRALTIDEDSFGKDHPDVAIDLNNLAQLLKDMDRLSEADPLMQRAIAIFVNISVKNGRTHQSLQIVTGNYRELLVKMGDTKGIIEEKIGKLMEPIVKK